MNVFIVEELAAILKNLQSTLSDISGVVVIGHAMDKSGAIERINALLLDVVILDIRLQSGAGFNVLKSIKKYHARIRLLCWPAAPRRFTSTVASSPG